MRYGSLMLGLWVGLAQAFYEPYGSIYYGYGRYRQVGQIQLLYPIQQNTHQLLYVPIIGLLDSNHAREANVGLGYRVLTDHSILGGYGFYDVRQTIYQHRMQQMTLGLEYLMRDDELRSNLYLPFSRAQPIHTSFASQHRTKSAELPLSGFDVTWSHRLAHTQVATGYYYFHASKVKPIQGPRLQLQYAVTSWLNIEGEWSYDKARGYHYFIGLRLAWRAPALPLTLMDKMTQMPLRDLDVVVQAYSWDNEHTESSIVISTPEELQSIGSGIDGMTLDANYLLAKDIDLSPTKHVIHPDGSKGFKPIGTREHPFTGRFFGQGHQLTGLLIEDIRESQALGLFGCIKGTKEKPAWIRGVHLREITLTGSRGSRLGGLAGTVKQAIVQQVSSQGHLTGRNRIGGLIGSMRDTHLEQASSHSSLSGDGGAIGGLVGYVNSCYLAHVHSYSCIHFMDGTTVGGLIGVMYKSNALKHAYSQGTIRIKGASQVGGLVGGAYNGSYLYEVDSAVDENHIYDVYSTVDIGVGARQYPTQEIGGLIGYVEDIKLERAYSTGAIKVGKSKTVGGLIGKSEQSRATIRDAQRLNRIRDVYSLSPITVEKAEAVGGLMGWMDGTDLQRAYSQGMIKVKDGKKIGGLIGFAKDFDNFADVYSTSAIEVGDNSCKCPVLDFGFHGDPHVYVGGLIGKGHGFDLNRAYSAGSIHAGAHTWVGGLGGSIESSWFKLWRDKRHIRHVYSRSVIEAGADACAAGLMADTSSRIRATEMHFFGTVTGPASTLIHSTYVRRDSDINLSSEPYEAVGQVTDMDNFPGWFAEGFWQMGPEGPELTWPLIQDALSVLQYANHLLLFKSSISELPMELVVWIFKYTQFYRALHTGQMTRLLYYALMPFHQTVEGKLRKLWTKEAFLNYVLTDTVQTGQKRSSANTLNETAKKRRLIPREC